MGISNFDVNFFDVTLFEVTLIDDASGMYIFSFPFVKLDVLCTGVDSFDEFVFGEFEVTFCGD